MKRNEILILLVMCVCFFLRGSAQNTPDSLHQFVLLEAGFPETNEYLEARSVVAKKWSIYYKTVAGCIVSEELMDSITKFNEATNNRLTSYYGEDWKSRYDLEVSRAYGYRMEELDSLSLCVIEDKNTGLVEKIIGNRNKTKLFVEWNAINEKEYHTFLDQTSDVNILRLDPNKQGVLYKGYQNSIELQFDEDQLLKAYYLECVNCTVGKMRYHDTLPMNQYRIIPNWGVEAASLNVGSRGQALKEFQFDVVNLESPSVYLNHQINGSSINVAELDSVLFLSIDYPDSLMIQPKVQLEHWEFLSKTHHAYGTGGQIDAETLALIKEMPSGRRISFICTARDVNGIKRKKAATFIIE